jgi:hypothetical protein
MSLHGMSVGGGLLGVVEFVALFFLVVMPVVMVIISLCGGWSDLAPRGRAIAMVGLTEIVAGVIYALAHHDLTARNLGIGALMVGGVAILGTLIRWNGYIILPILLLGAFLGNAHIHGVHL